MHQISIKTNSCKQNIRFMTFVTFFSIGHQIFRQKSHRLGYLLVTLLAINKARECKKESLHHQSKAGGDYMLYLTNRIIPFIVLGIITATSVAHAEDPTINRLLASQCAQCHGTNGYAVGDIDSLAGEDDLSGELNEMRNKSNPDDIMEHQAMGYTSDQIRRIAAYYATVSENGGNNSGDSDEHDSDEHKKTERRRSRDKD